MQPNCPECHARVHEAYQHYCEKCGANLIHHEQADQFLYRDTFIPSGDDITNRFDGKQPYPKTHTSHLGTVTMDEVEHRFADPKQDNWIAEVKGLGDSSDIVDLEWMAKAEKKHQQIETDKRNNTLLLPAAPELEQRDWLAEIKDLEDEQERINQFIKETKEKIQAKEKLSRWQRVKRWWRGLKKQPKEEKKEPKTFSVLSSTPGQIMYVQADQGDIHLGDPIYANGQVIGTALEDTKDDEDIVKVLWGGDMK